MKDIFNLSKQYLTQECFNELFKEEIKNKYLYSLPLTRELTECLYKKKYINKEQYNKIMYIDTKDKNERVISHS